MRTIPAQTIIEKVAEMCIAANRELPADVLQVFKDRQAAEENPAAKETFRQLLENPSSPRTPACPSARTAVWPCSSWKWAKT